MIDADLVIVDEASMIDVRLMHSLMSRVPLQAAFMAVGDTDQLVKIPGSVFPLSFSFLF